MEFAINYNIEAMSERRKKVSIFNTIEQKCPTLIQFHSHTNTQAPPIEAEHQIF
jgi:hypothetical protein